MDLAHGLRALWNHLGLRLALQASSAAAGFPASNLETGDLHQHWQGVGTGEQTLGYDAGAGAVETVDTAVVPDAVLLADVGANLALRRSDDYSAWSDVWTLAPITRAHLAPPAFRHYVRESDAQTRRGWQLRIYGTLSAPPALSGGLFLGAKTLLPTSPAYGFQLGADRAHLGADLVGTWPPLDRADAQELARLVALLTPDAAEGFVQTVSGLGYGGLPHWLWDPVGRTLSDVLGIPALLPVLCTTPEASGTASLTDKLRTMPTEIRWRTRT